MTIDAITCFACNRVLTAADYDRKNQDYTPEGKRVHICYSCDWQCDRGELIIAAENRKQSQEW